MTEDLFENCNETIKPYKRRVHPLGPLSSELLKHIRKRSSMSNMIKFSAAYYNQPYGNYEDESNKRQKNDENGFIEWGVNSDLLESTFRKLIYLNIF